jgi:polyisoprenoid-binding protein YceI
MTHRNLSRLAGIAAFAAMALSHPATAAEYTAIDEAKSRLAFGYTQMGVPLEGDFTKFDVQLAFDPARPEAARATMVVPLASVDAGFPDANTELAGKLWFDTTAHPTARFESTAVKALGGNRFEVRGPLTIKGRTREVAAPVTFTAQGNGGVLAGTFTLNRADFAIGEGMWADFGTVANEIRINFQLATVAGKK